MKTYLVSFVLFVAGCSLSQKSDNSTVTGSDFEPIGRTAVSNENHLEFIGSASHVGFSFTGEECQVFAYVAGDGHNYLQYELDGEYQKRVRISSEADFFTIAAKGEGPHTVWLYKATEATTGPVFLKKVTGQNIKPLKRSTAPFIEFIGNSITCGAAADASEVACGTGVYHDQHNAYYAYGPRVARNLKVNFMLSSVSGIGVYRNWNSDGPTMPEVYDKADFRLESNRSWDFSKVTPAIVSIALGTNDFSGGDGKKERLPFDSTMFIRAYVNFVQHVKSKYPQTRIALLGSTMVGGERGEIFRNCLTSVKKEIDKLYPDDPEVAVFFFSPMKPQGCTGHPSVEDHAIMAEEAVPFFRKLLE